jgi:hypothetical protein
MFLAIATTRGVCLWNPTTDTEKRWTMRVFDHDIKRPRFISVQHIQFVDQGRRLMFTTSRRTVEAYDLVTQTKHRYKKLLHVRNSGRHKGNPFMELGGKVIWNNRVVCSKDGGYFVTLDDDDKLRFWSLKEGTVD